MLRVKHELTFLTVLRTLKLYVRHPVLAWRSEVREWDRYFSYLALKRLGYGDLFDKQPGGAILPEWADLYSLYRFVRTRKPKLIYDLGSGCSTIMFAQAAADNIRDGFPCRVVAFESDPFWIEATRSYMPDHLTQHCDLRFAEVKVDTIDGVVCSSYDIDHSGSPNLVHVDGPGSTVSRVHANAYLLAENAPADYFIVIDGAWPTFTWTRDKLAGRYKVGENRVRHQEWLERMA